VALAGCGDATTGCGELPVLLDRFATTMPMTTRMIAAATAASVRVVRLFIRKPFVNVM
jgi:hypothetical protein